MKISRKEAADQVSEIIGKRVGAGPQDIVEGWQRFLKKILSQMAPHLKAGHMVTFQTLESHERQLYQKLSDNISIPRNVSAIYIPPSVRYQMMYQRPEGQSQPIPEHDPENPPDMGVILAGRLKHFDIIVNVLLAKPPFTPAIDVYENGQLLAGYVYNTIDECIAGMSQVLKAHFHISYD